MHVVEYDSALKKKEILPFATTWMKLENIILSEINQEQNDKYCSYHVCEESKDLRFIKAKSRM